MLLNKRAALWSALSELEEQSGQAIAETLVVVLVLVVLWVAIPWLAHLQDITLSATHASRHAAFLAARAEEAADPDAMVRSYFTGAAHRWSDRQNRPLLDPISPASLSIRRADALAPLSQPGGTQSHAVVLRREWSLEDTGVLQARLAVNFHHAPGFHRPTELSGKRRVATLLGLDVFDDAYPTVRRSISILSGAGHADSDDQTQVITASSALAWSSALAESARAGGVVASRADAVDAAWGRAAPEFDWMARWSGQLPEYLIVD